MRKRSKYRPRTIMLDAHNYVIQGVKPISSAGDALLVLKTKNHAALLAITQGNATRDDIDVVIASMNMAEAYALHGKGSDWSVEIKAAQDAIFSMGKRGVAKGKFLFTGPELQAANLGMEIHDAQLDASTIIEMEKMIDYVRLQIMKKNVRPIVHKESDAAVTPL